VRNALRILGFGKDTTFYTMLEAQAEAAVRAAVEFYEISQDFSNLEQRIRKIEDIEHEADGITHKLHNKIDSTFVTPLDKEDLRALSGALDDITDFIEAATGRVALYRLEVPRPDLAPLVGQLVQITQATREAVAALRNMQNRKALNALFIRIHEIENDSDQAYREALANLFNAPNPDPLMVIKWKEIYDRVEIAVDKCEDVANIVESVVVKYA
jgi:uncharacterized protein